LELAQQGKTEEEIAQFLTDIGHTSPKNIHVVLYSCVRTIRLKHRIFLKRSQTHSRHIPVFLTIPQIALQLGVTPHCFYTLINIRKIELILDAQTNIHTFPAQTETLDLLRQFKTDTIKNLRF